MESQAQRVRDEVREKVRRWRNEMLRTLPQPVIARITGWCLGGALTVTAGCDIAIASGGSALRFAGSQLRSFPRWRNHCRVDRTSSSQNTVFTMRSQER